MSLVKDARAASIISVSTKIELAISTFPLLLPEIPDPFDAIAHVVSIFPHTDELFFPQIGPFGLLLAL